MIRRTFRIGLVLGLLGAIAFALTKLLSSQEPAPARPSPASREPWPRLSSDPATPAVPTTQALPDPAAPEAAAPAQPAATTQATARVWVEPTGGACPTSHPVKAKLTSRIFHLPGMLNYDRTNPDRCYVDAEAAETDGLRAAKR